MIDGRSRSTVTPTITSPLSPRYGLGETVDSSIRVAADDLSAMIVLSAIQVAGLIVFLTNRTEPSPKRALIPPAWRLRDPEKAVLSPAPLTQGS